MREREREKERARLTKAENVGSYENPFQVKNGLVRNTLRTRSVTLQMGGVFLPVEAEKKSNSRESLYARKRSENNCACEIAEGRSRFRFLERILTFIRRTLRSF